MNKCNLTMATNAPTATCEVVQRSTLTEIIEEDTLVPETPTQGSQCNLSTNQEPEMDNNTRQCVDPIPFNESKQAGPILPFKEGFEACGSYLCGHKKISSGLLFDKGPQNLSIYKTASCWSGEGVNLTSQPPLESEEFEEINSCTNGSNFTNQDLKICHQQNRSKQNFTRGPNLLPNACLNTGLNVDSSTQNNLSESSGQNTTGQTVANPFQGKSYSKLTQDQLVVNPNIGEGNNFLDVTHRDCIHLSQESGAHDLKHDLNSVSKPFLYGIGAGRSCTIKKEPALIIEDFDLSDQEDCEEVFLSDDCIAYHAPVSYSESNNRSIQLGITDQRLHAVDRVKIAPNQIPEQKKYSDILEDDILTDCSKCPFCHGFIIDIGCEGELSEKGKIQLNKYKRGVGENIISIIDPSVVGPEAILRSEMFSRFRSSSVPDHTFRKRELGLINPTNDSNPGGNQDIKNNQDWDDTQNDKNGKAELNNTTAHGELGTKSEISPRKTDMKTVNKESRLKKNRRISADHVIPNGHNERNIKLLPSLGPVNICKCRPNNGSSETKDSSSNTLSPRSSIESDLGHPFGGHYPRRKELVKLSPLQARHRRTPSNELLSPSAEGGFRPISPPSSSHSASDSLSIPQRLHSRSPSPTFSSRSLSPIPHVRQRSNTFSGINNLDCSNFLSPPRSPLRLPRDPIQPSKGSISDLSDKHSTDDAGEEVDGFSLRPLPRQRSSTCPENRAWRRRKKMAANNRPPTPPPLAPSISPRSSLGDLTGRKLSHLSLSPALTRRSDHLPDLPLLLEDQDADQESSDSPASFTDNKLNANSASGKRNIVVPRINDPDPIKRQTESVIETDIPRFSSITSVG